MTINANYIAHTIALNLFPYNKYLIVPNTSMFVGWEADLLVVSEANWMDEIEIKISISDLRKDKVKEFKHKALKENLTNLHCLYGKIRKFYYAMPQVIYDKTKEGDIPEYAGVIVITECGCSRIIKPAKIRKCATKLTIEEKYKLARLGVIRYWGKFKHS